MNGSQHLDTQQIYDLLDGRLDALAERAARAHLLRCEECRGLERECAAVVESLRWYGSQPTEPPAGYWDSFWDRWSPATAAIGTPDMSADPSATRPPTIRRLPAGIAPALAMAAALALLVGLWWTGRPGPEPIDPIRTAEVPPLREAMASAGWADDYARFEQMSIAVGGIDPVSKGIALASLAQEP